MTTSLRLLSTYVLVVTMAWVTNMVRDLIPAGLSAWSSALIVGLATGGAIYGTQTLLDMVRLPDGSPLFPKKREVISWQTAPLRFLLIVSVCGLVGIFSCFALIGVVNDLVFHHGLK